MQIRTKLLKIYLKEEFNPKFIGLFLPGYFREEHGQPYDYARYTSFGLKYILEKKWLREENK